MNFKLRHRLPWTFPPKPRPIKSGSIPQMRGFTLLETVIAFGVILAAAVGPVSLVTSGIGDFAASKNKLIAANLAEEGIELIRDVRETNILCDSLNGSAVWEWNRDPSAGGILSNTTVGVAVDRVATISCGGVSGVSIEVPILSPSWSNKLTFDPATGIFGYTAGAGNETIFTRRVQIKSPPDAPDSGIPASDQMDVITTVDWNERGIDKSLPLRERLYNWK